MLHPAAVCLAQVCVGQAASMAAILLAAGEAGHRWAMPNRWATAHPNSSCNLVRQTLTAHALDQSVGALASSMLPSNR